MKKRIFTILVVMLIIALSCTACGGGLYNLKLDGVIYLDGEQTVRISVDSESLDRTTFLPTITKDDISLSGVLTGKSVVKVVYIDEENIDITLSGKVVADESDRYDYGTVTVSGKATANGEKAKVDTYVEFTPKMIRTFNRHEEQGNVYISEFELPYGSFISENLVQSNVEANTNDLIILMSLTDQGRLRIEVHGFFPFQAQNGLMVTFPSLTLKACMTTFNKDIKVSVGDSIFYASYPLT